MSKIERIRLIRNTFEIGLCDAKREVERQDLLARCKSFRIYGGEPINELLADIVRAAIPSKIGDD